MPGHEDHNYELKRKWNKREKLDLFIAEAFLVIFTHAEKKQNVTVDLPSVFNQYVQSVYKLEKIEFPEKYANTEIFIEKKDPRGFRKGLLRTFRKLAELGFIEVVESSSWRKHVINIFLVWEKEKK